jgi:predicted RNase H-like nuclease (RuvC/YqgF family)
MSEQSEPKNSEKPKRQLTPRTPEQIERIKRIRIKLAEMGLSFAAWCRENDIEYSYASHLIYGGSNRIKGLTGKAAEVRELIEKIFGVTFTDINK